MATTISSTTSTTSGTIHSAGLGSGLDVESIVKAMVNAESQPITTLQTKATDLGSKLSTFGTVKSYLSAFHDAAATLSNVGTWSQTKGTSSNATAVAVTSSSTAAAGSYSVEVQKLASAQSTASSVYAAATQPVGAGLLHVELGRWSAAQAGFEGKAGTGVTDISVTATDTLADVRDKINSVNAGITASILTDASGSRLMLRSTTTGADNGFRVTASDADGNGADASGLSALAYDPPNNGGTATTLAQSAGDAQATINGLAVKSATNTLTNVLDGVSLQLGTVTTAPVEVSVADDKDSMKTAVTAFVDSYNQLMGYLSTQTKYNSDTKTGGALQGDSTANGIRNQLRSLMSTTVNSSSVFTRGSDIGFDVQEDGTIKLDATKLDSALGNVAEMKKMFANASATDSTQDGLATQLRTITTGMLGTDGLLSARTQGIQSRIDRNQSQQASMQQRVSSFEARVRAQYTALDTTMSQMNSLSTYLTQQLTAMNNSNSSK